MLLARWLKVECVEELRLFILHNEEYLAWHLKIRCGYKVCVIIHILHGWTIYALDINFNMSAAF